ncbi:MAG: three component ABC system middle component [Solirubrobacteraceae bacterium]
MRPWWERPLEQVGLLNPAFLAVLVNEAATGHCKERDAAPPYPLAFLAVPVVVHEPTRATLPSTVRTSVDTWLQRHPVARVTIPPLAAELVPWVREASRFGMRRGSLRIDGDRIAAAPLGRRPAGSSTPDLDECRSRAHQVGRWFARAGDPTTTLALWGLTV